MASTAQFHALLIDDDPAYNYLNELLFEQIPAFHPPRFFADSQAALAFIEAYCIKSKQHPFPHLTMVDVNMPVMDGYDFVQQLRVLCPQVHQRTLLCFLSSSAHPKDQRRIQDIGVDCYYEKPLAGKHLLDLAHQLSVRF
jgi:CheY-like chemotaxis protein